MDMSAINWLAVLAASFLGFILGYVWYGPLFGHAWLRATGMDEDQIAQGNMAVIFPLALLFQFIMAMVLSMFFYGNPASNLQVTAGSGALLGFLAGVGLVSMALSVTALFEQRPRNYFLINGGYWTLLFTLMGLIIGAWR